MFEGLSEKLQLTFKKLTGKGKLSEKDIQDAMREVKMALLEADVHFVVVKELVKNVTERAIGHEIMQSLTPGQQVIKIVNEELTKLMGGSVSKINSSTTLPTVIMMVGLQGSGKTTTAGKLANYLNKQQKKSLLVACDIYRPAAIKQLQILGESIGIKVFERGTQDPVLTAREAFDFARNEQYDVLIVDTAGRLHINQEMMDELIKLKTSLKPHEIILAVDAMTGQDAVNVAKTFNETLDISGIILTKLDGDARGGAALSVKAVTGKNIKFVGSGEKTGDLEPFYPDRMASRILGMGDVLSLIEKAQSAFDENKAQELEKKLRSQRFTLNDFLDQLRQIKNMGSIGDIMSMIPGFNAQKLAGVELSDKELVKTEAVICSMTLNEREDPTTINGSRRRRIAIGSGTTIQDVNKLLKSFDEFRRMMKQFQGSGAGKAVKRGKFKLPFI